MARRPTLRAISVFNVRIPMLHVILIAVAVVAVAVVALATYVVANLKPGDLP